MPVSKSFHLPQSRKGPEFLQVAMVMRNCSIIRARQHLL